MELGRNKRIYTKQKNTIKLKIKTEITANLGITVQRLKQHHMTMLAAEHLKYFLNGRLTFSPASLIS